MQDPPVKRQRIVVDDSGLANGVGEQIRLGSIGNRIAPLIGCSAP